MWEPDHFRLFICHNSTRKDVAHLLKQELEKIQVSCFVAHDDIEPTREWQDEIGEALRTMDALAAILSPDFHQSNWTDQEVGFAIGTGRLVLPLRFGIDPYGFIGKFQGYQIAGAVDYPTIAVEIVKILSRNGNTALKMASALVKRFEWSQTWESAKTTMSLLEECAVIDEALLTRIEEAETNSQVRYAFGVPARIRALVARHRKIGDI